MFHYNSLTNTHAHIIECHSCSTSDKSIAASTSSMYANVSSLSTHVFSEAFILADDEQKRFTEVRPA